MATEQQAVTFIGGLNELNRALRRLVRHLERRFAPQEQNRLQDGAPSRLGAPGEAQGRDQSSEPYPGDYGDVSEETRTMLEQDYREWGRR